MKKIFGRRMKLQPKGYGIDKTYNEIIYVPEDVQISVQALSVSWNRDGKKQEIKLLYCQLFIQ